MMKRLFVSFLSLMLVAGTTQAATGVELKKMYDELNYSLSVEWDQKDKKFYDQKVEKFNTEIRALQSKGLKNTDVLKLVAAETKNAELRADLETVITQVQLNLVSETEAQKLINNAIQKSYAKGASWNGETVLTVVVGAIVVLLVVAYVQCLADPNSTTVCYDDVSCYSDYYGTDCYSDTSCACSR